jgi:hypothetical protein
MLRVQNGGPHRRPVALHGDAQLSVQCVDLFGPQSRKVLQIG